ncbi:MFS transporter [Streptomyces sp. NPDC004610]|uniref:MFS transporter n=1 Tax=unclassified Streptomyces TaxID=2593676 RepID=UPI0033AC9D72
MFGVLGLEEPIDNTTPATPGVVDTPPEALARRRRAERALRAATLTNGPNELLDFLLPLWAGAALGLSPTEVGVLLAVEMAVSVVARPLAGILADTRERRSVAAVGALLYGVSAAGYAVTPGAAGAYAAAMVGGAGGALLWVALRALVGERLTDDSAAFARLFSAQETGTWVAFFAGLTLIGPIGYDGVFWACAAACALAAGALLSAPRQERPGGRRGRDGHDVTGLGSVGRRLRPMLVAVVLTMTAEATLSLLLLLHLQRTFGLDALGVAYVFLPGAIAMSVAAERLHTWVVRFGRRRVLTYASLASAAFAANLAWAPNPYVIAVLWILSGLAWAAVIPVQQAVITEASGDRVGRGMGVYESAGLLGALIGSLLGGALYDTADWTVSCLSIAALLLAGAVIMPHAVGRVGVTDVPETPASATARKPRPDPGPQADPGPGPKPDPDPAPEPASGAQGSHPLRQLARRAALFAAVQLALLLLGASWLHDLATGDFLDVLMRGSDRDSAVLDALVTIGKFWTFALIMDAIWTGVGCVRRGRRRLKGSR